MKKNSPQHKHHFLTFGVFSLQRIFILGLFGASIPTWALDAAPQKINSATQLANLIGGLIVIVLLILGLSWFVKRFNQGGFLQNPAMKILASMPLGTRERLLLVDVGGQQLLLGVTATSINTLHVFTEPVIVKGNETPASSEFSKKLMAILQQKNTLNPDELGSKNSNH